MKRTDAVVLLSLILGAGCHSVGPQGRSRDLASAGSPSQAGKIATALPVKPVSYQVPPIPVSQGALAKAQQADPATLPSPSAASPPYDPVPPAKGPAPFPYPVAKDPAGPQLTPVSLDQAPAPAPAPVPPSAAPVSTPQPTVSDVRRLYQAAAERCAGMDSYIARLRRREVVNGKLNPEEVALFKFRREPWSVYFKWIGTEGKDREAVYVKGKYEGKLHTLLAAGDMLLMPAGTVFALDPHSPHVLRHSRHPITEAGIGSLVQRFGQLVQAEESHKSNPLLYLGPQQRPEYAGALEAVEQTIQPRAETHLLAGGRRWWFFDPANGLPVLVITHDEAGKEVEYYCYDRIQFPVKLDDDDFNPNKLWPRK